MRDADVRLELAERLQRQFRTRPYLLAHEVDIRWAVPARMDVMLVADRIIGYEIKSDLDSLRRLPRQVDAYRDVVERAYLVVGERHRAAAMDLVPNWWGVWLARWSSEKIALSELRRGRLNPSINPLAVTTFLSRRDLVDALTSVGERQLSSRAVDDLRALLVGRLGTAKTLAVARTKLRERAAFGSPPGSTSADIPACYGVPGGGAAGGAASWSATSAK